MRLVLRSWAHNEPCDRNFCQGKAGARRLPVRGFPAFTAPGPNSLSDHSSWFQGYISIVIPSSCLILPSCLSLAEMSTEGSKYINKEIKNSVKGLKQIKNLIEHTNDERKSLLSSLEEAKRKKEVRKSQVTTSHLDPPP